MTFNEDKVRIKKKNQAHIMSRLRGFAKDTSDSSVWELPNGSKLTQKAYSTFLKDGLYINIHSPALPKGELRGQIKP